MSQKLISILILLGFFITPIYANNGSSLFRTGDFDEKFLNKLNKDNDPVSNYLKKKIKQELEEYNNSNKELTDPLRKRIVDILNEIIKKEDIWDLHLDDTRLRERTKELIREKPEECKKIETNRSILEDYYPEGIVKHHYDDNIFSLQIDIQGDIHFSRYNFTDIKNPYDGFDGWMEVKLACWLDNEKSFSPYVSLIHSSTSEDEFFWQKYIQISAGIQYYPLKFCEESTFFFMNNLRLYAMCSKRSLYDNVEFQHSKDLQIGIDYYWDNLFSYEILENKKLVKPVGLVWFNGGFRNTNFSDASYNAFLFMGNVKLGIEFKIGNTILLPYGFMETTYVPKYRERWWENILKGGVGLRIYPKVDRSDNILWDLLKRFHIYAELINKVAWLGETPSGIEHTDIRLGIGFSTGGFYRRNSSILLAGSQEILWSE